MIMMQLIVSTVAVNLIVSEGVKPFRHFGIFSLLFRYPGFSFTLHLIAIPALVHTVTFL